MAELLIVVAIIAVLVAIAIPVFSNAVERSREATDLANVRSAYAEVKSAFLSNGESTSTEVSLEQAQDGWQSSLPITIGGISSDDSEHWIGTPGANGTCKVEIGSDGNLTLTWSGGSGSGGTSTDPYADKLAEASKSLSITPDGTGTWLWGHMKYNGKTSKNAMWAYLADLESKAGLTDATLIKGQLSKTDNPTLQWVLYTKDDTYYYTDYTTGESKQGSVSSLDESSELWSKYIYGYKDRYTNENYISW